MLNTLAQISSAGKVTLTQREMPEPREGQALVKIHASCICGSDLHLFRDKHPSVKLPVTVGHEFSGVVQAIGKGVSRISVGDRVVVEPIITCGHCDACRHGEYGYCENVSFTYRQGDGALAEFFLGDAERMFVFPKTMSFEAAALTEPMAVALHAVRRAGISIGDRVAIVGAGAIGILIGAIARRIGAAEVVISDMSEFRLQLARKFGATRTVHAQREDIVRVVRSMSNEKGFERSFECVGSEQTLKQAIDCVRTNGLVTDVGIFERPRIQLDVSVLVSREIRLQGSQGYCWDFEDALRLVSELKAERLITHVFPLEETQQAFETLMDSTTDAVKVCIVNK